MKRGERRIEPGAAALGRSASPAREAALAALNAIREGSFAEQALSRALDFRHVSPEDRALATEITYGAVRWRHRLDAIIDRCLTDPRKKLRPQLREILRLAVFQLALLDRVPPRAAVNEAVIQARARFDQRTASLVNAVLRNALRNWDRADPSPDDDAQSLATYYSHPLWLVERWLEERGPEVTRTILTHNNSRAVLVIRLNRIKATREELVSQLESARLDVKQWVPEPDALLIGARRPTHEIPGFLEGLFAVQDSASQMVAPLLGTQPGERVLDACAAPGGKTTHLAALTGNQAEITAMDSDSPRLEDARQNLARLGVTGVRFVVGDAANSDLLKGLGVFDRILLDPPCSNLGVLRHNPEVKYRIAPEDPLRYSEAHLRMLNAVATVLKPGGTLLFSVCTVTAAETVEVARRFEALHPELWVEPILPSEVPSSRFVDPRGYFTTFPPTGPESVDGFFAVRFIKA